MKRPNAGIPAAFAAILIPGLLLFLLAKLRGDPWEAYMLVYGGAILAVAALVMILRTRTLRIAIWSLVSLLVLFLLGVFLPQLFGSNPLNDEIVPFLIIIFIGLLPLLLFAPFFARAKLILFPTEREWIAEFYRQMSRSYAANIPPEVAILAHSRSGVPRWLARPLRRIARRMATGLSFSESAAREPGIFTPDQQAVLETGEKTDRMPEVLTYLASLARARQASGLPIFLILVELWYVPFITAFILMFIIPKFKEIFDQLGGELPVLTQQVINLSYLLTHDLVWIIIAGLLLALILYTMRARGVLRHVPLIHNLYWPLPLSRFSFSLSALIGSGVGYRDALPLAIDAARSSAFRENKSRILDSLEHGRSLHASLAMITGIPAHYLWFLKTAEDREQLAGGLMEIAEDYRNRHVESARALGQVIFPAIVILTGLAIAMFLIAFYLPLFNIPKLVG